jgi:hypothetical protein
MRSLRRLFQDRRTGAEGQGNLQQLPRPWILERRGESDIRFKAKACRVAGCFFLVAVVAAVPVLLISALVHTVAFEGAPYSHQLELYNDASSVWSYESQFFLDAINGPNQTRPFFAVPIRYSYQSLVLNQVSGEVDPLPSADVPTAGSGAGPSQYPTPRPYPQQQTNIKLVLGPDSGVGSLFSPIYLNSVSSYATTTFVIGPVTYNAEPPSPSSTPRPKPSATASYSCWSSRR